MCIRDSRRSTRWTRLRRWPAGGCRRSSPHCGVFCKPGWASRASASSFVKVLRLMEVFRADEVAAAVRDAIARGAIGFDAVKHLVLCRIERRPPRLDMTVYPYLPQAYVAMTSAKMYLGLLTRAAS